MGMNKNSCFKLVLLYGVLIVIVSSEQTTKQIIDSSYFDEDPTANTVSEVKSYPHLNCTITVNHTSAMCLADIILSQKIKFAQMKLTFKKNVRIHQNELVVNPQEWFWSYTPVKGSFPYFKWPWDFSILSFGLLNTYTLRGFKLFIDVTPSDCNIQLGSRAASMSIARALANMTSTYLSTVSQDYNHSYWCFMQQFPEAKNTLAYTMDVYMGYPSEFVGYRCCRFKVNKLTLVRNVECFSTPLRQWRSLLILPFILSIILLLFSPLILMNIAISMSRSGYTRIEAYRMEYKNIDMNNVDNESWVILNNYCPISLSTIVFGFGGLSETHPVIVSRIRRALFVFLSPLLVYIKVILHFYLEYDLSKILIEHGAPLGFISMIADFEKGRKVFLTNLGGPCVVLASYLVLGFIVAVFPQNLAKILEDGISATKNTILPRTIFSLDLDTIERISLVTFNQRAGYRKLLDVMMAQCSMILRPKYWTLLLNIQTQRWTLFWSTRFQEQNMCHQLLYAVLKLLALIVYVTACGIETVLGAIFYGIPIINFTIIGIRGFIINFSVCVAKSKIGHAHTDSTRHVFCTICRCLCKCVFSVCFVYFAICFCEIICASFEFFANVICFSYLSAIVFPDDSFGYLFFSISFIYFVWNDLSKFGKEYHELLNLTVTICKTMLNKTCEIEIIGNTIVLPNLKSHTHNVSKIKIQNTLLHLTEEQQQQLHVNLKDSPMSAMARHIQYFNVRPAISKPLFDQVIRKHRPVHIYLFLTMVEVSGICMLVYISLTVFSQFYHSRDASGVIKVLTMLVIGTLPQILRSMFLDTHKVIEVADLRARLEQTITEFCNYEYLHPQSSSTSEDITIRNDETYA